MKALLTVLLIFYVISVSHAQVIYTANAVIPFDSSLVEMYSGTTPTTWSPSSYEYVDDRNGNPKSAVKLDAILDYGNPEFSRMDTSDFTIAFWFRKDGSLWSEKSILQKKFTDLSNPSGVFYEEYGMFYNDWIGNSAQIRFKPFNDSAVVNSTLGFIEDSVWRHFAMVFDRSDSLYAYLDGQLYLSKYIGNTAQYTANIDSAVLEVGNGNISLDDLFFFSYALNASEVDELFNTEYASLPPPFCPGFNTFAVYPNPSADGYFHASFPTDIEEEYEIHVYDMLGNEIRIIASQDHPDTVEFRLNDPAAGHYMMHIQTKEYRFIELIQVN